MSNVRKYHEKEAFVTGHTGTSWHQILLLCAVVPVGLHLYYSILDGRKLSSSRKIAVECVALILPMLLVQTSPLSHTRSQTMFLLTMITVSSSSLLPSPLQHNIQHSPTSNPTRPTFLSIHRSSVYLLTTVAILAVDFPLFPRNYCKTETGGYGWMDLGAASFVILSGWTASLSSSESSAVYRAVKKCTPLLVLGVVRLATNKGLEYQEHVSEYGVHWNFFFTLCVIEGLGVVWRRVKGGLLQGWDGALAVVVVILYQMYLSKLGGQEFMEYGDRRCSLGSSQGWSLCDVFVANREGILGVAGYWSLRLLSEEIGSFCFQHERKNDNNTDEQIVSSLRQRRLLLWTGVSWITHFMMVVVFRIPTSRRSTNLSFILWALSHNLTVLSSIHYVVMIHSHGERNPKTPELLHAVNRFGFAVFIISNILTGLINLSMDTINSSDGKAMVVLLAYLMLVCVSALILDRVSPWRTS